MKKLLNFYLPECLIILKFFAYACFTIIGLKVAPLSKELAETFTFCTMFLAFPAMCYFNPKIFIATHVHWILLSPIKAWEIVLANATLNVIKLSIISLLLGLFTYVNYYDSIQEFFKKTAEAPAESLFSGSADLALSLMLFHFLIAFIFILFPDQQALTRERLEYKPQKMQRKKLIMTFVMFLSVAFFTSEEGNLGKFLPGIILYSLVLACFVTSPVFMILNALKLYHSPKLLTSLFVGSFILYLLILFQFSSSITNSKESGIMANLEEMNFKGIYFNPMMPKLLNKLHNPDASIVKLRSREFNDYFKSFSQTEQDDLLNSWSKNCTEKKDYNCRLASYVHAHKKEHAKELNFVLQSCPNDLQSCYGVVINETVMEKDRTLAEEHLTKGCKGKTVDEDNVCCSCYRNYMHKKLKK